MKNPFKKKQKPQDLYKEYAQTLESFDHLVNVGLVKPDYEAGVMSINPTMLENQKKSFVNNWAMRAWVYMTLKGDRQYEEIKLLDWENDDNVLATYEPPKDALKQ